MSEKRSLDDILESIFYLIKEAKTLEIPEEKSHSVLENEIPSDDKHFKELNLKNQVINNVSDKTKPSDSINKTKDTKKIIITSSFNDLKKDKFNAYNWSKLKFSKYRYQHRHSLNNIYYIEKYIFENSNQIFKEEFAKWIKLELSSLVKNGSKKT